MSDVVFRSADGAAKVEALYRQVLAQWPVAKTERVIETRVGSTFVLSCGPDDGPPVVLLHGAQANSAAWIPDVPVWSAKFRLHAVDVIGEAGLSARVRPPLSGETHALWLDDVFSALGLTSAALVGTSFGGWLALDYAVRRPAAVRALALICPAGLGRQKNFLLKAAPFLLLGRWGERKIRAMVFGPAPARLPVELEPIAALMDTIGRAIRPRIVVIPQISDAALRHLAIPVLAIVGGRDVILDSRDTKARLEAAVPQAQIRFVEEGYHFLPGETRNVMAFLERSLPET